MCGVGAHRDSLFDPNRIHARFAFAAVRDESQRCIEQARFSAAGARHDDPHGETLAITGDQHR